MSRKLFCTLIAIFIVASVLISANKLEKEPVFISPNSGEVTIGLKQYAVTRTGWGTCSKGLTQDYVDHAAFSLELYKEGVLIQTVTMDEGYWVWTSRS